MEQHYKLTREALSKIQVLLYEHEIGTVAENLNSAIDWLKCELFKLTPSHENDEGMGNSCTKNRIVSPGESDHCDTHKIPSLKQLFVTQRKMGNARKTEYLLEYFVSKKLV